MPFLTFAKNFENPRGNLRGEWALGFNNFTWKLFLFTFNDEMFLGVEKRFLKKTYEKNPLKDVGLDGGVLFFL